MAPVLPGQCLLAEQGVIAEGLAKGGLGVSGEKVEPEVGGADGVGFLDDELAMGVVASHGPGEGEASRRPKSAKTADCIAAAPGASVWAAMARWRNRRPSSMQSKHGEEESGDMEAGDGQHVLGKSLTIIANRRYAALSWLIRSKSTSG